jgi:hypothetical protein
LYAAASCGIEPPFQVFSMHPRRAWGLSGPEFPDCFINFPDRRRCVRNIIGLYEEWDQSSWGVLPLVEICIFRGHSLEVDPSRLGGSVSSMVIPYFHSRPAGLVESARPEVRFNSLACLAGTPELVCLDGSRQLTTLSSEDSGLLGARAP